MVSSDKEKRVRRMIDQVVSRGLRSKVENRIYSLFVLCGAGLVIFAFQRHLIQGVEGMLFTVLFVVTCVALFVLGYIMREMRKVKLLGIVVRADQVGERRLNQQAYMLLIAEHRVIEEADFRRELAKAMKSLR